MSDRTIEQLIEVQGTYAEYVSLSEIFDDTRNLNRMARYRPIKSHREAFQKLAASLNVRDKRCYFLRGAYGTGKSHLCLMFANYLQTPAAEPPMPAFFEHYAAADPHAAEDLRTRRSSGRYLVAVCSWGGSDDFGEIVLRALDEALKREGFAEDLDTPYRQALAKLDEWQKLAQAGDPLGHFYPDFEQELAQRHEDMTMAKFRKRLAAFDRTAFSDFRSIYHKITTGPFAYDKADLVEILTYTLASKAFKERFLGILVLFDEFGDAMEKGNLSPKLYQRFAELCAEPPTECARLIFVGTGHRPWTWYAKSYNATDFRVASDRTQSIELDPQGVEDIIAAIVAPKKDHALWRQEVAPRSALFDKLLTDCTRLKLFSWLTAPKVRQTIIENIYPMHPMATHALLRLAEDVASNNRSVFTFFAGDVSPDAAPGSYGRYIATTPVETSGKLNLYTADLLVSYFESALTFDNRELRDTIRDQIKDYETSLRELRRVASQELTSDLLDDALIARILRIMLVYSIISTPTNNIENKADNIAFGLYCSADAERREVANRLDELVKKGVLYYIKPTGIYEFRRSTTADLDHMVERYKSDEKNIPQNIVAELNDLVPLSKSEVYLEAKDHNLTYNEDKRLLRRLVRPPDLTAEEETPQGRLSFFAAREADVERDLRAANEYEGIALYVVCETTEDIEKARAYCARNESQRVMVAIPNQPIPMLDAVLNLRALLAVQQSDEAKSFTFQDQTALSARLEGDGTRPGARDQLRALRDKLFSNREVTWYGAHAERIPTDANKPHDIANRVMEILYDKTNRLAHDDLNKLHIRVDRAKSAALKDATEDLLDYTTPITIDTSFAQNRGDIRYLQKCLLHSGVLKQVKAEATKLRCEFELQTDNYASTLPALAAMIDEVRGLKTDAPLGINDLLLRYRRPPYGQGPVALILAVACLRRAFGDSIRFRADPATLVDLPVTSFDHVWALVEGQYPNAVLSYRPLQAEEKRLVKTVYSVFGGDTSAADRDYTIAEAHTALSAWWDGLPPLARVTSLYPAAQEPVTAAFVEAMHRINSRDAYSFLFDDLPAVFGAERGFIIPRDTVDAIAHNLPAVKQTIDGAIAHVEARIMAAVRSLFAAKADTYQDIADAIRAWYNGLDSNQKDTFARWHTQDTRPLIAHLKTIDSLAETFMVKVPKDYNLKPVREWMTDHVQVYADRLKRAKQCIDNNRLKVDPPEIRINGKLVKLPCDPVAFKDRVQITVHHANAQTKVYVAEGNVDPTDPDAPRRLVNDEPLVVENNTKLSFAAQDAENNWSQIVSLDLVNQLRKHEIRIPLQRSLGDQAVTFVFPVDADSFTVVCRTLIARSLEVKIASASDLAARLQALVDDLKAGR